MSKKKSEVVVVCTLQTTWRVSIGHFQELLQVADLDAPERQLRRHASSCASRRRPRLCRPRSPRPSRFCWCVRCGSKQQPFTIGGNLRVMKVPIPESDVFSKAHLSIIICSVFVVHALFCANGRNHECSLSLSLSLSLSSPSLQRGIRTNVAFLGLLHSEREKPHGKKYVFFVLLGLAVVLLPPALLLRVPRVPQSRQAIQGTPRGFPIRGRRGRQRPRPRRQQRQR